ncbi:HET-domain-containing protein [Xylariaceae sp. FL1019]|nr:HET-domain-containing protein [Xylariaceae sp. FL1019]
MTANQSRRRTEFIVSEPSDVAGDSRPYQPLDTAVDCTRVVEIQNVGDAGEELVCELHQVVFGDRPRYEALSYMWGDTTGDKTITLNGCKLKVGDNLWDALHYLRDIRKQKMHIWIDALCINQSDVDERNKQLRIMRHIYSRARTVVVWLGKKYSKYQDRVLPFQLENFPPSDEVKSDEPSSTIGSNDSDVERTMASELCKDEYWTRLWIIQEITQAAGAQGVRAHVCFGRLSLPWDKFMHFITNSKHGSDETGPSRLSRQLTERYAGGHTFKNLLKEHIHAKCKEPRDKIYGIVGLAADARGFTMDYNRSLFDVWKDTMEFLNRRLLLKEEEIVYFGRLVKFLLMGDGECTPLQQSLGSYGSEIPSPIIIEDMKSPHVFHLDGRILGAVLYVGPSTGEYVAELSKVEAWDAAIQRLFAGRLGAAHQESNTLTEAILNKADSELNKMCSEHVSTVRWESGISYGYSETIESMRMEDTSTTHKQGARQTSSNNSETTACKGPLLFQMQMRSTGEKCPWNMGISTNLIQAGDLVCWVQGIRKAIIVRKLERFGHARHVPGHYWKLQIYGSCMVSGDVVGESFGQQQWNKMEFLSELPIKMDAATLFVLLP